MAIIRFGDRPFFRNPWIEFERMRREMDQLTRGIAHEGWGGEAPNVYPALVVSETKDAIHVEAQIPGVAPEDLEISVEGETLTIKGERRAVTVGEKVSYHRREIEYGRFNRAINLPTRISAEKVTAKAADGILSIVLPKVEEVKPRTVKVVPKE
ncbi:MAG: Hsp20/alpha crystallin family protein [Thermodesulfobacteriota bacterium]